MTIYTESETEDSDKILLANEGQYRVYPYRFIIVALFAGLMIISQVFMITTAPITTNLIDIYGINALTVSTTSLVYLFLYVPVNFPANWMLDDWSIRKSITIAALLTLIGAWIRTGSQMSYGYIIAGQTVGALAQPLIRNAPAKVSATWFSPRSRGNVTVLLSVCEPIGVLIGYVIPGLVIPERIGAEDGKPAIFLLMFIEAIVATVILICVILFFKEKPPTPPSYSSSTERYPFKESLKKMISNKDYMFLTAAAGVGASVSSTLASSAEQLLSTFNFTQVQTTFFGAALIISGVFGAAAFMAYINRTKQYKKALAASIVGGSAIFCLLGLTLSTKIFWLVLINIAVLGFTAAPILPIAYEYSCEITFPVGEAMAGGLIICLSQLMAGILTIIINTIYDLNTGKLGGYLSAGLLVLALAVASVCVLMMKQNLNRTKNDALHMKSVSDVSDSELHSIE